MPWWNGRGTLTTITLPTEGTVRSVSEAWEEIGIVKGSNVQIPTR